MAVTDTLLSPRTFLWSLRVVWVALAVALGIAISRAVHDHGTSRVLAPVVWWAVVAVVVVALVVPSATSLTAVRLLVPATVPAALAALVVGAPAGAGVVALALAMVATLVSLSGEAGEALVQGSAYGDERRFPLRVPAPMLLPVLLSWVLWCTATLGAVVLLGAQRWVVGVVVGVLAAGLTWLLWSRFHMLSRRWLVLVPAGVVVHDALLLGETLMVQRPNVALARLALADTEAADLTGPAAGHAVEVSVHEMVLAVFPSSRDHPTGRAIHVQSFLVGPSRPGRALQAMSSHKLPVG